MKISTIKEKYSLEDGSMYGEKNIEDSLAMLYHENSKFTSHSARSQAEIIGRFLYNPYIIIRSSQPYKHYPGQKTYDLSVYSTATNNANIFELLKNRRSIRSFQKNYKISLNEISNMLYNSYGVTQKSKIANPEVNGSLGKRNVPSGGGLYPLEIYIVIFKGDIPSGLYHYNSNSNNLELIKKGEFMDDLLDIIQAEPYVDMRSSSALILTTGIIERVLIKYGDRGYRFLMQESGFVGQTISLLAESLDLGSCMLGGYYDDKVNSFLGVDGVFETINNVIVIGKKQENSVDLHEITLKSI